MMGSGQKVYAVLWNPENYDRAAEDPNWKGGGVCFGYPSFFFGIVLCAMEAQKICDRPHTPNIRDALYYRFPGAKRDATVALLTKFLAPFTRISPFKGLPPHTVRVSSPPQVWLCSELVFILRIISQQRKNRIS